MKRILACILALLVVVGPEMSYAQSVLNLPAPGTMVHLSAAINPVVLRGMTVHPENPLHFDFIVDKGDTGVEGAALKAEGQKLVNYFLAGMTVPRRDLWVNLSPVEKDRIMPDLLVKTELGREFLAQDYLLKQLTASLIYPEDALGKKYWTEIYALAQQKLGTTDIPMDAFNKVWIMPDKASVYEKGNTVYVTEMHLKVMLESDYQATTRHTEAQKAATASPVLTNGEQNNAGDPSASPQDDGRSPQAATVADPAEISKKALREIIIPVLEKEVNEGTNFAVLRQAMYSLVLAQWYQTALKESILNKAYAGKNKIAGIDLNDSATREQVYAQYIEAYKKGVFNYIKEEPVSSGDVSPKKYFSGGVIGSEFAMTTASGPAVLATASRCLAMVVHIDPAMATDQKPSAAALLFELRDVMNATGRFDSFIDRARNRTVIPLDSLQNIDPFVLREFEWATGWAQIRIWKDEHGKPTGIFWRGHDEESIRGNIGALISGILTGRSIKGQREAAMAAALDQTLNDLAYPTLIGRNGQVWFESASLGAMDSLDRMEFLLALRHFLDGRAILKDKMAVTYSKGAVGFLITTDGLVLRSALEAFAREYRASFMEAGGVAAKGVEHAMVSFAGKRFEADFFERTIRGFEKNLFLPKLRAITIIGGSTLIETLIEDMDQKGLVEVANKGSIRVTITCPPDKGEARDKVAAYFKDLLKDMPAPFVHEQPVLVQDESVGAGVVTMTAAALAERILSIPVTGNYVLIDQKFDAAKYVLRYSPEFNKKQIGLARQLLKEYLRKEGLNAHALDAADAVLELARDGIYWEADVVQEAEDLVRRTLKNGIDKRIPARLIIKYDRFRSLWGVAFQELVPSSAPRYYGGAKDIFYLQDRPEFQKYRPLAAAFFVSAFKSAVKWVDTQAGTKTGLLYDMIDVVLAHWAEADAWGLGAIKKDAGRVLTRMNKARNVAPRFYAQALLKKYPKLLTLDPKGSLKISVNAAMIAPEGGIDARNIAVERKGEIMKDVVTGAALEQMITNAPGLKGLILELKPLNLIQLLGLNADGSPAAA
ncbi:MAG: hypothetical protein HQL19_06530 [Candidatus Omnitrophica bacterium]|nr:hypothetical protein [Candidatus Omnitrophota bacterium]